MINSHSESINIEFYNPFDLEELIQELKNMKGVVVLNDSEKNEYPLASIANDTDEVYIGRIRRDESLENGVNIFVVADNIRKGAASNAVQIAEYMVNNNI